MKLKDKAAQQIITNLRRTMSVHDLEIYECDKGDGNMVFVEKGEMLPAGWVTKRGPKGVFHYCPAHSIKPVLGKHEVTENGDSDE